MKSLNQQTAAFVTAVLVLFCSSALAIDFFNEEDKANIIWEAGRNTYIKYAEQDSDSSGKNEHPVDLDEADLVQALELMQTIGDESEPVFTTQQIRTLSKNLVRGLAKARSDQDIIFALKKSKKRILGLKANQFFTAGRAFYKDGKLNIIIGDYDRPREEGYEAAYDPTHVGIVKYRFNHGKRSRKSGFKEIIVETGGIDNNFKDGKRRDDWFTIDLQEVAETVANKQKTDKQSELARKRKELLEILGSDPALQNSSAIYESKERRRRKEELARQRKTQSVGGDIGQASGQSVEERLATLKRLKDKGLISEKEYAAKRDEILDTL